MVVTLDKFLRNIRPILCRAHITDGTIHASVAARLWRQGPYSSAVSPSRFDLQNPYAYLNENSTFDTDGAFLQTMSIKEPVAMLAGADYSAFSRFDFSPEEKPTHLRDVYGIDVSDDELQTNIGKLVREDLEFVESKSNEGVQIADLQAAGIRRCLRLEFSDNETAAMLLGKLMVRGPKGTLPVPLLGFLEADAPVDDRVERLINIMRRYARNMLAPE